MYVDPDEVSRSFPWVKELWLFGGADPGAAPNGALDLLVVSAVPPKEVLPGQRNRLLARLQAGSDRRIELRLTTSEQLARWLCRNRRFTTSFRKRAVKLFERPAGTPRSPQP
ncbi:MAG: hypothetical protein HYY03_05990 [Chloroflexi bacterium]|nr:hypothetical protein [Chloroflexota bacterium]